MISNTLIDAGAYEYEFPTSVAQIAQTSLLLYPNPVSDILHIEIDATLLQHLQIVDASGRIVLVDKKINLLDFSALSPGIYFLTMELTGGEVLMARIVKQ